MQIKETLISTTARTDKPSGKVKKDKVIGIRVPSELADQYEIKCMENQHSMTEPLRKAFMNYLN